MMTVSTKSSPALGPALDPAPDPALAPTLAPALAPGAIWDDAPVLLDLIGPEETILYCNGHQAATLGRTAETLTGRPMAALYTPPSARLLRRLLRDPDFAETRSLRLKLKHAGGATVEMNAMVDRYRGKGAARGLRIVKTPITARQARFGTVQRDYEMLDSIISTAKDACWCIEFQEPVDLSISTGETVRQVFDNPRFWRVLNPAMAELYRMPLETDIRQEDVAFIFPRNPENVAFVKLLAENDFNVDNALSRDQRYDGAWIDAENDVRAYIRDNFLIRMWGTVRDVTRRKRVETELNSQIDGMKAILGAISNPVIVVDAGGRVEAANPALERDLGWILDDVLGRPVSEILGPDDALSSVLALLAGAGDWLGPVEMRLASGEFHMGDCRARSIASIAGCERVVLTLQLDGRPRPISHPER